MSNALEVTTDNFDAEVLQADEPVLVDFLGSVVWTMPPDRPND